MAIARDRLYAGVSPERDPDRFDGALVVSPSRERAACFNEHGFAPASCEVVEVTLNIRAPASAEDLAEICGQIGITITDDAAVVDRTAWLVPGEENQTISANSAVRAALQRAGFDSYRDEILLGGRPDVVTVVWVPGSFIITRTAPNEAAT